MLTPAFAGELFGAGQPLDATKYFIILPDSIGHGKSSKPSDGLKAKFPKYNYADMVDAQYRLLKEGLGINHLRLVIGNSMGGMHTWLWGVKYPDFMDALAPMASQPTAMAEPQLDDAPPDHRFHPQRSRLEGRRLHDPAQGLPDGRGVLRHRHQRRHARLPEDGADARGRPTSFSTSGWPRRPTPTPTTISTSGNPRATTIRRPAWSASRRRCWPSTPPTTSAIRRRPASPKRR